MENMKERKEDHSFMIKEIVYTRVHPEEDASPSPGDITRVPLQWGSESDYHASITEVLLSKQCNASLYCR